MMSLHAFNLFLIVMAAVAVLVFVALFYVNAGYGKFYQPKWGPSLDNHWGWFLMEVPVFAAMLILWWISPRRDDAVRLVFSCCSNCIISTVPSFSRCSFAGIAACPGLSC